MLKPHGYAQTISDAPIVERDTIKCGHCQAIVTVKPGTASTVYLVQDLTQPGFPWREEPGAFCRVCMRAVCLRCHADGRCLPWERRLAIAESRHRFLRSALG